jgi:hypothetical protein
MKPLAMSLDKLQTENNGYLGYIAPTILIPRLFILFFFIATQLSFMCVNRYALIRCIFLQLIL